MVCPYSPGDYHSLVSTHWKAYDIDADTQDTYPTIALGTPTQTNQTSSPIQTHMDISSPIRQTTRSLNAAFRAGDLNSLDEPFATQLSNAEFPAKSHRPFLQDRKRGPSSVHLN
ncbi:hypothetical protein BGAL_0037g00460 [Botrytis galanthina]|uniref:Uncharacterized protein n=1 Tax=Botrytis galanthina TaxID=278940 RepID=A0A4S8RA97_9HELO|nr:hypothetical protein BGAL_0037g00460 [Botrytis galanthina]